MPTNSQKIIPYKGVDLETDETLIEEFKAVFLKNVTFDANRNPAAVNGANAYVFTPVEANAEYTNITLPAGDNFCIGYHPFRELNQGFAFIYNSNGDHTIYRINGNAGTCEKVIGGSCLNFQLNPKHFISEGRCTVQSTTRTNPQTGALDNINYLLFTDNYNEPRFICVEDAIATNGFTGSFFTVNDSSCTACNNFNLGVPSPEDCISITTIGRDSGNAAEEAQPNLLNFKGWQFRLRFIDVWGRESDYGNISDAYISALGGVCVANSNGLPRCLKLKFKAGCPTIDKIELLIRTHSGNVRGFSTETDWYLYDTINKYTNTGSQQWWQRSIRTALNYDSSDNTIEYTFCGDKERIPVNVADTNRNFNPLPIASSSIFPMNRRVGLARNKRGYEPLSIPELAKVQYTVTAPTPLPACDNIKQWKITIYGVIWNPFEDMAVNIREKDGTPCFGLADCYDRENNPFSYMQTLPKGQEGIIGYLAGTKSYSISKQYEYDRQTSTMKLVDLNYSLRNNIGGRYFPIQKWEFTVAPGEYVFRLASHTAAPTDEYHKTSTRLIGQTSISSLGTLTTETYELVINVGSVDVEVLTNPLMIYDFTRVGKGCLLVDRVSAAEGYLYEDEINKIPIERAKLEATVGVTYGPQYTDHNGYYWGCTRKYGLQIKMFGWKNCVANQLLQTSFKTYDSNGALHRFERLYVYEKDVAYPVRDRYTVKGKVVLCTDNTIGVPGALVILTRGGYAYTNSAGEYSIIAHNTGNLSTARTEDLIFSQRGTCQLIDCDTSGCNSVFAHVSAVSPACAGTAARSVTVANVQMRIKNFNKKGPNMGGRYGIGIIMHDWMGRQSFVQANDLHVVDIPTLHETKIYSYSTVNYNLTGVVFPSWVRGVTFAVTKNLRYDDYLTWAIDRVQFVDNTGNTNNASPTAIRLYYEGLAEYNKQKGYATNTAWDVISNERSTVSGDEVEFMANGDGTIFGTQIRLLVQYDKEGKYFQVEYNDELKDLTAGAQVKLIRPALENEKQFYYELCPTIKVVSGTAQTLTGTVNIVDSYLQTRQIPVPVEVKVKTKDNDGNEIETSVTQNELRSYSFPFEHHSPSDLWGDHFWNKGRVNIKNPQEKQHLLRTEIAVTASLSTTGSYNGLSYFNEKLTQVFDEQEFGGIAIGLSEINTLLVICEHDNFIVSFDDDSLTLNSAGQLVGKTGDGIFGRPQSKIGNNFGCQLKDINTIRRRNGKVMFIDSSTASLVLHNFAEAKDVSVGMIKSYIASKIKYVAANAAHYFIGIIDPKNGEYLLSNTVLNQVTGNYINDSGEVNPASFETVAYDMNKEIVKGWYSFVPEYYGMLEGDSYDQQLISFRQGKAWRHHNINGGNNPVFNTFYGTVVDKYMEVVYNLDHTKVKLFLWNEVYCADHLLFIDRIKTEGGQLSRLMPMWWTKYNKFWSADFKCATNTQADANLVSQTGVNALLDGDLLQGRWLKARYKGKQADRTKYFELTALMSHFIEQGLSGG